MFFCSFREVYNIARQIKSTVISKLVPCRTDDLLLLSGFEAVVTLTLILDRVIQHIIMHESLTSIYIPNFIEIGKTSLWTD